MTELRAFNDSGIQEFRKYLAEIGTSSRSEVDHNLLFNDNFSYVVSGNVEIQPSMFYSKLEAAEYLFDLIKGTDIANKFYNVGLWSWLAAYYFDSVCPPDPDGQRKVGKEHRYILAGNREWRIIYRHLLAGPVRIYAFHGSIAKILLYGPLDKFGDFSEQITSRPDIATNKGIINALNSLYWDEDSESPKKGSTNRKAPGTLRRFINMFDQFEMNYDLYSMSGKEIFNLLPAEFDRFKFS